MQDEGRAAGVGGEHRHAVEAGAGRDDAPGREEPARRLQAYQSVEGRRHPPRAGRVRAEREGHETEPDGDGRAGARATGDPSRVGHGGAAAVRAACPDQAGRELIHVRLANQQRPRLEECPDDRCRLGGRVGEAGAARRRREPGDVDVVLDCERNPVERKGRIELGQGFGGCQHVRLGDPGDPDRLGVGPVERLQQLCGHLRRRVACLVAGQ